jgi:hypothetical protein
MVDESYAEKTVRVWLWLFPAVYLLHIAEEYWCGGGYSAYVARTSGVNLSPTKFLVLNGVGLALTIMGALLARRLGFSEWLLVCLATVVLINGLSHTIITVLRTQYNPGFVSGLLIFIPLGTATLLLMKRSMRARRYFGALAVGVAIHACISLLALSGGQFQR